MDAEVVLTPSVTAADELIAALRRRGYVVIGLTVKDGAIVLEKVRGVADLPAGWTHEQDCPTYRLRRTDDPSVFAQAVSPRSPRRLGSRGPSASPRRHWCADADAMRSEQHDEMTIVEPGDTPDAAVTFEIDGVEPSAGEAWSIVINGGLSTVSAGTICSRASTCPDRFP